MLGDQIAESLADIRSVDQESYIKVLAEKCINLKSKATKMAARSDGTKPDQESVGWT